MQVIYARENAPEQITKSIYLAGPTPRSQDTESWRPEALLILEQIGFDGVVYVPEPRDGVWKDDYVGQIEWESTHMNLADCILFWVPRDMETMPALTTNIEWGEWQDSGRVVLGAPDDATSMRYLNHFAKKLSVCQSNTLSKTIQNAVDFVGDGALRTGGEREVPLFIWNTPHFQQWYSAQTDAGNRLDGARVVWTFRVGPTRSFVFFWAIHVDVYIAQENRNKTNEVVLSRPDIATIVAYYRGSNEDDIQIAIIREFRSPAATSDCYIREVPGGSSWRPNSDPLETMANELKEETGLEIQDMTRIEFVGTRQLNGTLSAHKAHVFAVELTKNELEFLRIQERENIVHGVIEDTECTYVEIHKLDDLISTENNSLDWSMLGMILTAIRQNS